MDAHMVRRGLMWMLLIGMPFVAYSLAPSCARGLIIFGDSFSDTGNYEILYPSVPRFPWTYRNPIPGRVGNGYTMVDLMSRYLGLGTMLPNYGRNLFNAWRYSAGVNFAVEGATARDSSILVPYYLSLQVDTYAFWRNQHLISQNLASNALHLIYLGTNDIVQNLVKRNDTLDHLRSTIVPQSVDSIMKGIERLHDQGARNFMVVGVAAMGCFPMFRTILDHDSFGCSKPLNELSNFHNVLLQRRLALAQIEHPDSSFIYADLYNLNLDVLKNPKNFGFSKVGTQTSCCTGLGPGQCTWRTVCSNPNSYMSWDGLHFTEAFNRIAARSFLTGKYIRPATPRHVENCLLRL